VKIPTFIFLVCGCWLSLAGADLWAAQAGPTRFKPSPTNPFNYGVVAEGRIVPQGRSVHVFPDVSGSAVIDRLLVSVNQTVSKGDVISTLQSKDFWAAQAEVARAGQLQAEAAYAQAKADAARALGEFESQRTSLEQALAAAKVNLDAAQASAQSNIEALSKKYEQAKRRLDILAKEGAALAVEQTSAIAAAQATVEATRAAKETKILNAQLGQATAAATRMLQTFEREKSEAEVGLFEIKASLDLAQRKDGVAQAAQTVAQAQSALDAQKALEPKLKAALEAAVAQTRAAWVSAQAVYAQAHIQAQKGDVLAPQDGVILALFAYPGEVVGSQGICEIADTRKLEVQAQVYVDEVSRIRLGAEAQATGAGIDGTLSGKVVEISRQVIPNTLLKLDPSAFSDQRIVLVRIALENPEKAENVLNAQVTVSIEP